MSNGGMGENRDVSILKAKDFVATGLFILFMAVLVMRPGFPLPKPAYSPGSNSKNKSIIGIDVSHYQGSIDWGDKSQKELAFVYIKATEGKHIKDPYFEINSRMANRENIPSGAYHFFDPGISGAEQAHYFLRNLKGKAFQLPPVIDIEITKGVDKKTLIERARKMYTIIKSRTGCDPMIYSDVSFYREYIQGEFEEKYLWLAEYGIKEPPAIKNRAMVMWQKTDRGKLNMIKGLVDVNEYLGNRSDFVKFACGA